LSEPSPNPWLEQLEAVMSGDRDCPPLLANLLGPGEALLRDLFEATGAPDSSVWALEQGERQEETSKTLPRDIEESPDPQSGVRRLASLGQASSRCLGRYQLLERIGGGGMGVVYKARHTLLKNDVALKLLPAERMEDASSVARFRHEIEAV